MAITVPQSRLILRSVMAALRNNLAFSDLVDWEPHSAEMNDRNGLVVSEQVGPEYTITETTGAVADLSAGVQDTVFGSQTFTLNRVFGCSFGASDIEMIKDLQSARKSRALNNGIARMASRIDAHIADTSAKAFPWSTGTWGTAITTPEQFASAHTRLKEASIESDMNINAVMSHADRQNLAKYIYNDSPDLMTESSRAMRRGFSGMLDGIPQKSSNNLGIITTGSRTSGTATVTGANQNVNYSAVADAGSNAGYYLTQTLNITTDANATIADGEVFSIAGVNAWDPDRGAIREFGSAQFVVVTGATASGTGTATIRIFPAIIVGDGTSTTGDAGVNNANRTVDAAPANGATITFLGSPSTTYKPRMMFRKDAVVVHSAQLMMPYTGQGFRRALADAERDGVAPLMPRLWFYSDPNTGAHKARIDVFVEAQARDRWAGVKFFG